MPDSPSPTQRRVLVVDDIFSIRLAIQDYLAPFYTVSTAGDAAEALELLAREPFDVVVSDIRMPGKNGIELIQEIRARYPHIQYALMTAYNVDDYVRYAREYAIWNLIPKSTLLDLHFVKVMIDKLTGRAFSGFKPYFPRVSQQAITIGRVYALHKDESARLPSETIFQCSLLSEEERFRVCDMVADIFRRHQAPQAIRVILEELTVNARDYGSADFTRPITLSFGIASDSLLFSVTDDGGALTREEILARLERNVCLDERGRPLSLTDEHGRGLYISRESLDHLVFNIETGRRTEVLGILQPQAEFRSKAIWIYLREEEKVQ